MCLAGEALLGRRETGAGRPVRLRSTPPEPAPWKEELLRVLFMLEQREGALEAQRRWRTEGMGSTSSLVRQANHTLCSQPSPTNAGTQSHNHFQMGQNAFLRISTCQVTLNTSPGEAPGELLTMPDTSSRPPTALTEHPGCPSHVLLPHLQARMLPSRPADN